MPKINTAAPGGGARRVPNQPPRSTRRPVQTGTGKGSPAAANQGVGSPRPNRRRGR